MWKRAPFLFGLLPINVHDQIKSEKIKKLSLYKDDNETGWDRVRLMYTLDDYGHSSPELATVQQSTFFGIFLGAVYGGFTHSKGAYLDFMERNQATSFSSHFEAKKELQNYVSVNFGKGAFKWGWRVGLFTGSYLLIATTMSAYRGGSNVSDYVLAGGITGACFRINLGPKGMLVGGIVGSILGCLAGISTTVLLKVSGTSMEEMRFWQYKWIKQREMAVKTSAEDGDESLIKQHDVKIGKGTISLDSVLITESEKK